MRGLETMQMRVSLSLSVMLAMTYTSIREGQPQRNQIADCATGSLTAVKQST